MVVPVTTSADFRAGLPQSLFTGEQVGALFGADGFGRQYDVTNDGQRFVVVQTVEEQATPMITVVQNWAKEFEDK